MRSERFRLSFLLDSGGLAFQFPEIIEFCPTNLSPARTFNFRDPGGMERKNTLNANTAGYFSHGKRLIDSRTSPLDTNASKNLNTFFISFDYPKMHSHIIPCPEFRDIRL
jgi:hypothetical protein